MQGIEVPIKDVCLELHYAELKLMIVDLCRKDAIRNQTESAITVTT
jgi:hypothetical protein